MPYGYMGISYRGRDKGLQGYVIWIYGYKLYVIDRRLPG